MGYRVAIIGAGAVAQRHLEALTKMGLQGVAIADIDQDRAQQAAMGSGMNPYTDYREMIGMEQPDIAVITLPHFLHKEVAVWCARHGCHMLLEKPMALNREECDEINQAVAENQVKLMVGHTQHYLAENRKAKEILAAGELGDPVMIQDTRHLYYYHRDRPDWFFEKKRAGGGILMNLGAHSIDKIQWLTDSRITKVKASLSFHGDRGDVEGSGTVFMETSKGFPATLFQSGYPGAPKNETELICTKGMLKWGAGEGLWLSRGGDYRQVPVDDQRDPFVLQLEELVTSIQEDREPECSGEYARTVVSVLEIIYCSHKTGRELVVGRGETSC